MGDWVFKALDVHTFALNSWAVWNEDVLIWDSLKLLNCFRFGFPLKHLTLRPANIHTIYFQLHPWDMFHTRKIQMYSGRKRKRSVPSQYLSLPWHVCSLDMYVCSHNAIHLMAVYRDVCDVWSHNSTSGNPLSPCLTIKDISMPNSESYDPLCCIFFVGNPVAMAWDHEVIVLARHSANKIGEKEHWPFSWFRDLPTELPHILAWSSSLFFPSSFPQPLLPLWIQDALH